MGAAASTNQPAAPETGPAPSALSLAMSDPATDPAAILGGATWDRVHIHLLGARNVPSADLLGESDAYVVASVVAEPEPEPLEGISRAFEKDVGTFKSRVIGNDPNPDWDVIALLLYRRGARHAAGSELKLRISLRDKDGAILKALGGEDDTLLDTALDLPAEHSTKWADHTLPLPALANGGGPGGCLTLRVRTSPAEEQLVSQSDLDSFPLEDVVLDPERDVGAVLQTHVRESGSKALLWVIGRNDCFMHPHAGRVFAELGFDLFVLNWKNNGACRRAGRMESGNPMLNSHPGPQANWGHYDGDVQAALDHIAQRPKAYAKTLCYAHSTGGPVVLSYLLQRHATKAAPPPIDGYIFNSPFLDWGWVGGDLMEFVLEVGVPMLLDVGAIDGDSALPGAGAGELSPWAAKLRSWAAFDLASRPMFRVPVTAGFAKWVTGMHGRIEAHAKDKSAPPITDRPFLMITSKGDDVLVADETISRAEWIGPRRTTVDVPNASHDVLLSCEKRVVDAALGYVRTWLEQEGFGSGSG
jgi:alpha-beta hydrolase superfamily lysophospholipase